MFVIVLVSCWWLDGCGGVGCGGMGQRVMVVVVESGSMRRQGTAQQGKLDAVGTSSTGQGTTSKSSIEGKQDGRQADKAKSAIHREEHSQEAKEVRGGRGRGGREGAAQGIQKQHSPFHRFAKHNGCACLRRALQAWYLHCLLPRGGMGSCQTSKLSIVEDVCVCRETSQLAHSILRDQGS